MRAGSSYRLLVPRCPLFPNVRTLHKEYPSQSFGLFRDINFFIPRRVTYFGSWIVQRKRSAFENNRNHLAGTLSSSELLAFKLCPYPLGIFRTKNNYNNEGIR